MHRLLVTIIVIQFVAIVALALALFSAEDKVSLSPGESRPDASTSTDDLTTAHRVPTERSNASGRARGDGADQTAASPVTLEGQERLDLVLFGRVSDREGAPLEARITLVKADDTRVYGNANLGNYAIPGLATGTWTCEVKATGYRQAEIEIELGTEPARRLDFVLDGAVVLKIKVLTLEGEAHDGKVLHGGPMPSLIAVATAEVPQGNLPMTAHQSQSRYGLGQFKDAERRGGLPNKLGAEYIGELELSVDPPVQVSLVLRHVVIATQPVGAGVDEVVFRVAPSDLDAVTSAFRVRLLDGQSDEPIAKARVDLSNRQYGRYGMNDLVDGVYAEEKVTPGLMTLNIAATGFGGISRYVILEPGKTLDLGTIRLQPAATIKGQVLDAEGKACSARVSVRNLDGMTFPQPVDLGMGWTADAEGHFEIEGNAPGRHWLSARTEKGELAEVLVEVAAGATVETDLRVRAAAKVKMVNKIGNSDYLLIRIVNAAGQPVWARHLWGASTRDLDLLPGSYRLEIYRDLDLLRSEDFRVGSASSVTLNVP